MNDTTPEIDALFRSMLLQRSGEQRLRMACSMFDTAKALATASIREKQPDISEPTCGRRSSCDFTGTNSRPPNVNKSLPPFHAQRLSSESPFLRSCKAGGRSCSSCKR